MKKVTGIGGVFFRCRDKTAVQRWYKDNLGVDTADYGASFLWREHDDPDERGYTVWGTFDEDTEYFGAREQPFMLNFRVHDLDALVEQLKKDGVEVKGDVEQHENGKFAWVIDGEGNRVELWEPVPSKDDPYLPPA